MTITLTMKGTETVQHTIEAGISEGADFVVKLDGVVVFEIYADSGRFRAQKSALETLGIMEEV